MTDINNYVFDFLLSISLIYAYALFYASFMFTMCSHCYIDMHCHTVEIHGFKFSAA